MTKIGVIHESFISGDLGEKCDRFFKNEENNDVHVLVVYDEVKKGTISLVRNSDYRSLISHKIKWHDKI